MAVIVPSPVVLFKTLTPIKVSPSSSTTVPTNILFWAMTPWNKNKQSIVRQNCRTLDLLENKLNFIILQLLVLQ